MVNLMMFVFGMCVVIFSILSLRELTDERVKLYAFYQLMLIASSVYVGTFIV
jgi:hypothetical membrane protein